MFNFCAVGKPGLIFFRSIKVVVPHDLNKSLASVSQISRESVLRRRKNQLYRQQCISSKMTRDLKSARSVSASLLAFSISRMRLWFCLDTSHYLLWLNSEISGFQFRYIFIKWTKNTQTWLDASLQSYGKAKALMVVHLLDMRLNPTNKKYIFA